MQWNFVKDEEEKISPLEICIALVAGFAAYIFILGVFLL